jgi:ribosomal protein L16 Arg81 hydroxylase
MSAGLDVRNEERQESGARFADLIAPVPVDEFFARHWERAVLHVPARSGADLRSLFTLDQLDHLLAGLPDKASVRLARTSVAGNTSRLVPGGASQLPSLYESFGTGHTIVVDGLHAFWPPVRSLCRHLVTDLGMQVQANLYVTPPSAAGFACHWDGHDVLILQLEGAKAWSVFERDAPLPRPSAEGGSYDPGSNPPRVEVTLQPGDVFYIPRGAPHRARTSAQPSVHLTVGLISATWEDLLAAAIESLVSSRPELRRSLPQGWLRSGAAGRLCAQEYGALVHLLTVAHHVDRALDLLATQVLESTPYPPDGHFRHVALAEHLTLESRVRRRPDLDLFASHRDGEAKLALPSTVVRGPSKLFWAFEYVAGADEFVVGDIPGWYSDDERLVIARVLVRAGCLRLVSLANGSLP